MSIAIRLSHETEESFDLALEHSPLKKVKKRVKDATILFTCPEQGPCEFEHRQRRQAPRTAMLDDVDACKAFLRVSGISLSTGWIAMMKAGEGHA